MESIPFSRVSVPLSQGRLARYAKLWVVHAPGMPGTFSPPPRISDPTTHVPWCMPGLLTSGSLWSRWRGKRSRHSRRMRNPQFYVSGKRPLVVCRNISIFYPKDKIGLLDWHPQYDLQQGRANCEVSYSEFTYLFLPIDHYQNMSKVIVSIHGIVVLFALSNGSFCPTLRNNRNAL